MTEATLSYLTIGFFVWVGVMSLIVAWIGGATRNHVPDDTDADDWQQWNDEHTR